MRRRSGEEKKKKKMSRSKCFSNGYRFNSMVWREGWEIILYFFPFLFPFQNMKKKSESILLSCFAFLQFSALALAFSFPPTSISTSKIQGRSGQNCRQFSLDKTFLGSSKKGTNCHQFSQHTRQNKQGNYLPSHAGALNSLKELGCIQRDGEHDTFFELKLLVAPQISQLADIFHLRHSSEDTSTQIQERSRTRSSSRRPLGLAVAVEIKVVTVGHQGTVRRVCRDHRITEVGKNL